MRIGILSRNGSLYSTRRLMEAATQRGHEVRIVDYSRCYMNITASRPQVLLGGEALDFDAIVPRIGASMTFYGTAVVRQFEMMQVFSTNTSQAITRSRDKLRALQLLSREGIGLPVTGFARSTKDIDGVIAVVGGPPLVIKLLEGTQGVGVVLAETKKAAESVMAAFRQLDANMLVQEYIAEANGEDLRAFVIGGKVVAAMRRARTLGELGTRRRKGAHARAINFTPDERTIAVRASKALGLDVAGVDMLRSRDGPLVIEVNSTPGLEGVERASHVDVADKIIEFLEKKAERGTLKDRIRE